MDDSQFFDLIAARTGLEIRAKDRENTLRALRGRVAARGLRSDEEYYKLLRSQTPASRAEWEILAPLLTNGESYFWRDRGQFALLKNTILPQLLRERRGALRVWSAGCSSGEETYSLAMLIEEVRRSNSDLRALPDGRLSILGTDINEQALARARRGFYGNWSFRGVDAELRDRYFERRGDGWQLRPAARARVSFAPLNLNDEAAEMNDFDLIVCRNVLIYLTPAAVERAVQTFTAALRTDGYLLTGHAELTNRHPRGLSARIFPESAIYQKSVTQTAVTATVKPAPPSQPRAPVAAPPRKVAIVPAKPKQARKQEQPEIEPLAEPLLKSAQKLADTGAHVEAIRLCQVAIAHDSVCVAAHLLWAHIEIERGETGHAKTLLKKVMYLAPESADAYLELATLYDAENDDARAATMRAAAAKIGG